MWNKNEIECHNQRKKAIDVLDECCDKECCGLGSIEKTSGNMKATINEKQKKEKSTSNELFQWNFSFGRRVSCEASVLIFSCKPQTHKITEEKESKI